MPSALRLIHIARKRIVAVVYGWSIRVANALDKLRQLAPKQVSSPLQVSRGERRFRLEAVAARISHHLQQQVVGFGRMPEVLRQVERAGEHAAPPHAKLDHVSLIVS